MTAAGSSSQQSCPRCGAGFECGAAAGRATCWCFSLPHIMPLDGIVEGNLSPAACLCPSCLRELIARREEKTE